MKKVITNPTRQSSGPAAELKPFTRPRGTRPVCWTGSLPVAHREVHVGTTRPNFTLIRTFI